MAKGERPIDVKDIINLDKGIDDLINDFKKLEKSLIDSINNISKNGEKISLMLKKNQESIRSTMQSLNKTKTGDGDGLVKHGQNLNRLTKEYHELTSAQKRNQTEGARLQQKLNGLQSKGAADVAKLRVAIQQKNKALKQEAMESMGLISLYQKQSQKLNQLRHKYKDVALSQGENSKAARKLRSEITSLDNKLKRVDANVGQFQRSVGNYGKAWQNVGRILSAAGLIGGLTGIFMVVKNAFRIMREFDKEMTNMAGVAGLSRSQLASLEKEIRRVAASSINTANAVAKTATALFTLGQTKDQIQNLLASVNSLSIALNASADEAGELLIQTLNAFGKSSAEAQNYADIIAKMASATALDFERTREALGYIAPVAKAVGLSLEETGALIGVLVDNGIQASRAGRLMSTSFSRLVTQGKTLQEALDQINSSTNKTKTATELFGAEAFALALILADNEEKTKRYTATLEDSAGALKELTDTQLGSLDAQIKILGSTWEEFVLRIESGEGAISKSFIRIVKNASAFIEVWGRMFLSDEQIKQMKIDALAIGQLEDAINDINKSYSQMSKVFEEVSKKSIVDDAIESQQTHLEKLKNEAKEVRLTLKDYGDSAEDVVEALEKEIKATEKVIKGLKDYADGLDDVSESTDQALEKTGKLFLELSKWELEWQLQVHEQVASSHEYSLLQRYEAEQDALDKRIKLLELEKRIKLEAGKEMTQAQIDLLNLQTQFAIEQAKEEGKKRSEALLESMKVAFKEGDLSSLMDSELKDRLSQIETAKNKELEIIEKANLTRSEKNRIAEQIEKESQKKMLLDQITFLENKLSLIELEKSEEIAIREELSALRLDLARSSSQDEIDISEQVKETLIEIQRALVDVVLNLYDRRIQALDVQLRKLEDRKDLEMQMAEDNKEAQIAIEQRFLNEQRTLEAERAQIARRQATFAKLHAIFEIGLNTATAIAKQLPGLPFTAPLIALIGALGAAQVAAVAAAPLPAYAEGTESAKGGLALVSEEGQELGVTKQGQAFLTPKEPALVDIPEGAKIFNAQTTKKMLEDPEYFDSMSNTKNKALSQLKNQVAKSAADYRQSKQASQPQRIDYNQLGKAVANNLPRIQNIVFHEDGTISQVQTDSKGNTYKSLNKTKTLISTKHPLHKEVQQLKNEVNQLKRKSKE